MGTGTLFYCILCERQLEAYQINPETGVCWECDDDVEDTVDNGFPPENI